MTRRIGLLPWLLPCALVVSCSNDEPTEPLPSGLESVTLAESPAGGAFLDIAFSGTRGIAVGAIASGVSPNQTFTPYLASLDPNGTWVPDATVPLPATGFLTAVSITSSGKAVIAGADASGLSGFILDERNGWSQHSVPLAGLSFASNDDTLRLAGYSSSSEQAVISTSPDSWVTETLPFPVGQNERGVQDLSGSAGGWAACGFDDGGDGTPESPNSVLFLNQGMGWQRISVACGGCSNWEFRSVGVGQTGGVLLGGAETNFAGGGDEYTASLLLRSVSGDWASIVLPKPTDLKRVNDILIAQDGAVYLACGMGGTWYLMRWAAGGGIVRDATLTGARINRLAESPDGTIWVSGAVLDAEGNVLHAAIWKRIG